MKNLAEALFLLLTSYVFHAVHQSRREWTIFQSLGASFCTINATTTTYQIKYFFHHQEMDFCFDLDKSLFSPEISIHTIPMNKGGFIPPIFHPSEIISPPKV
jgi:hypothetical protein